MPWPRRHRISRTFAPYRRIGVGGSISPHDRGDGSASTAGGNHCRRGHRCTDRGAHPGALAGDDVEQRISKKTTSSVFSSRPPATLWPCFRPRRLGASVSVLCRSFAPPRLPCQAPCLIASGSWPTSTPRGAVKSFITSTSTAPMCSAMTSPTEAFSGETSGNGDPRRALIVGTGLIGGSLGLALRARGWHVSGLDRDAALAHQALAAGALDTVGDDMSR